ncbi:hypothetical protein V495_07100 [Pseudogymnoascus sp. VKM F-4514 (FW-929)]|nr:hypothetical protein V490_01148 [Pseudogymnoascus sp. VKM F-3557]KFY37566.1 hypothetical protein V495_07100 [Pseudogymnoascus sp. VKM F-4514 (FW-929)]KFY56852.1 hypothetical protein V497_05928 [Pseudogymnoascus sp. VKM F-4516 (FW-969)]
MHRWSVDRIFHRAVDEMHQKVFRNAVDVGSLGDTEKHQGRYHGDLTATVAIAERHWGSLCQGGWCLRSSLILFDDFVDPLPMANYSDYVSSAGIWWSAPAAGVAIQNSFTISHIKGVNVDIQSLNSRGH